MESFLISFNLVFPLFLLMAMGYYLRQLGWINEGFIKSSNKLGFYCFLSMQLFRNIYQTDVAQAFNVELVLFAVISVLVMIGIGFLTVPFLIPKYGQRSVVIQSLYRSNYVVFGIPIISNLYGADGVAVISMLIAIIIPMFNIVAVFIFAVFSRDGKLSVRHILHEIVYNPLIIAAVVATIISIGQIDLPDILDQSVNYLADVAIPLALITLGADCDLKALKHQSKSLVISTVGRLVIVPLIFTTISVLVGLRGVELVSLVIMYAAPVSVSSYVMAENAKADGQLAAQVLVMTSLFSCISIMSILSALEYLHLL